MPSEQRNSMVFYASFYEASKSLNDLEQLEFLRAILEYALYDKKYDISGIAGGMFALVKPQLDANVRRYENGCKGGRPKNQNETKTKPKNNLKITKTKPNYNENENYNENDNDNIIHSSKNETASAIDYQNIFDLFNSICTELPKVRTLSEQRKKQIKSVYRLVEDNGGFSVLFQKIHKSDFLNGKTDSQWSANFDWIFKKTNIIKILEGNYDNKSNNESKPDLYDPSRYDF